MKNKIRRISKMMSLVLRHNPKYLKLELDKNGWANVQELLNGINAKNIPIDLELMKLVVEENDKKRFSFNADFSKIRANQGHSIKVDVELPSKTPPALLYHGTVEKFIPAIRRHGLSKMKRQHVHMSSEIDTATIVGSRRGQPIILEIRALEMAQSGHTFYLSENGVWLTDHVPSDYIIFP